MSITFKDNPIVNGWTSPNVAIRSATTAATAGGLVGLVALGSGVNAKIGNRSVGHAATMGRAAGTAMIVGAGIGALSGLRLSNDRFAGTWEGYGLGAAIGGGGAASIAGVWMVGKNIENAKNRLAGVALMGAAGGALLYGALGFTGAVDHK